jgi:hypothetical protein
MPLFDASASPHTKAHHLIDVCRASFSSIDVLRNSACFYPLLKDTSTALRTARAVGRNAGRGWKRFMHYVLAIHSLKTPNMLYDAALWRNAGPNMSCQWKNLQVDDRGMRCLCSSSKGLTDRFYAFFPNALSAHRTNQQFTPKLLMLAALRGLPKTAVQTRNLSSVQSLSVIPKDKRKLRCERFCM